MLFSTGLGIGMSTVAPLAHADEINLNASMSHDEYINVIGPKAQKVADDYGLYASVMIAQSIIESGWASSGLAQAPNYNLFGIKGDFNGQSVHMNTKEQGANGLYDTSASFRKYDNYEQSLEDNAIVVSGNLYQGAWKENTTSYKDATAALTGVYASALDYGDVLNSTIENYDLTRFDVAPAKEEGEVKATEHKVEPDFKIKQVRETKPVNYKVKANDSLWGVARENKVSIDQIRTWNEAVKNHDSKSLPVGEEIKVAEKHNTKEVAYQTITETKDIIHKVQKGETLNIIAEQSKMSTEDLLSKNPTISIDSILHIGDEIKIGEETKTYDKELNEDEKQALIKAAEEKAKALDIEAARKRREELTGNSTQSSDTSGQTVNTSTTVQTSGQSIKVQNASEDAQKVIDVAAAQIGKPYVWGARGPDAFDCSGLTQYAYKQALGIEIGSWTVPQESAGQQIHDISQAQPGDLYFWGSPGGTSHVAIALGNGEYIHAPQPGENVKVGNVDWYTPNFIVRVIS